MSKDRVIDSLGRIDDDMIQNVDTLRRKKKRPVWKKWGAMAACLCLVVEGAMHMIAPGESGRTVLQWSDTFQAKDYFKYNTGVEEVCSSHSIADIELPYAASRYFSDYRVQMESDGVIPVMPDHLLYECVVNYNEDGSIFSITHAWHQRGDTYSDLTITMGYQEVPLIQDCICIEVDENGNIVEPAVTVTERDGIRIVTEGSENREKTMTFQNETAWYQIAGSWGDSYESVAALLDWVWEHPVDFEMFAMEKGAEITTVHLSDDPNAFAEQLPDFKTLGYFLGEDYLQLKDGEPYAFEGHYYTGVTPEQVADGSFYELEGWTEIHWCIDAQPDYYDLQKCLGNLSELKKEQAVQALTEGSNFSFMLDGAFIKIYCKDAEEAWRAVESLKN